MNPSQLAVLAHIEDYPECTVEELIEYTGYSTTGVYKALKALTERGLVHVIPISYDGMAGRPARQYKAGPAPSKVNLKLTPAQKIARIRKRGRDYHKRKKARLEALERFKIGEIR